MKYKTTDELAHFIFADSYIGDIQVTSGFFHMVLDNVTILPENSCNRDIREMRANNMLLKIEESVITYIVEEGYKVYDANGRLMQICEDVAVEEKDYAEVAKTLIEGVIYSLEKREREYVFTIDAANERTYRLCVSGTHDAEEWDRFLNKM